MKSLLKKFVLCIVAATVITMPVFGANTQTQQQIKTKDAILGFWESKFDSGELQYHFHKDGNFHSHLELKGEASSFGEGTYTVSGNEVTLRFTRRIINCEDEASQQVVMKKSAQMDVIKFKVDFAPDGKTWSTNFGDFYLTFVEDEDAENWIKDHVISYTGGKHKHKH